MAEYDAKDLEGYTIEGGDDEDLDEEGDETSQIKDEEDVDDENMDGNDSNDQDDYQDDEE